MKNHYDTLEIKLGASDNEIKKAYRILAIKYHPDKNMGDEYFSNKFIEIKEAYDILINPNSRLEYDLNLETYLNKQTQDERKEQQEKKYQQKQAQKAKEEQFYYEPFKPFYSFRDRDQQETPQFEPEKTPWGEDINGVFIFFKLPKKIGKIVGGYSNLVKGHKKTSFFNLLFSAIISSYIAIPVIAIIMFLLWNNWHNNLHKENATETALIAFGVLTLIVIIFKIYINYNLVTFNHLNYYIGVNGFALFKCEGSTENITSEEEVNFNDVTDLYTSQTINKRNFRYESTSYEFVWMNTTISRINFVSNGTYYDEKGNPNEYAYPDYWMNKYAENYWTIYLLDNMEQELDKNGYISFKLYDIKNNLYIPYIKLGVGQITFIKGGDKEFTYKFNDIKRMYSKGSDLFIEHKNFQRTFYFFKSGNADKIPMLNLCNRQFFYKAMELLLGYKI